MMEEQLVATLAAGLPGVPVVFGVLPGIPPGPVIVLNLTAETASYSHSGVSDLRAYRVQIDCYGPTYSAAKALWQQVREILAPPYHLISASDFPASGDPDEAKRLFRVSADYRIHTAG